MIVTLKQVKYKAFQYTGPEQNPLPPNVIIYTEDCRRKRSEYLYKILYLHNKGVEESGDEWFINQEITDEMSKLRLLEQKLPPGIINKGDYSVKSEFGQAFLMDLRGTKHPVHIPIEPSDWIVKCTPVVGAVPVHSVMSSIGYWHLTNEEFKNLFEENK